MGALLDWLLGPRDWSVIMDDRGAEWATQRWCPAPGDRLVRSNLRQGGAQRLALRLRQKREDTPERLI